MKWFKILSLLLTCVAIGISFNSIVSFSSSINGDLTLEEGAKEHIQTPIYNLYFTSTSI